MDRVMVTLHGGEPLSASLIGRIKSNDLAVLKVERGGQEALPLSPLARPSAGESLLAIGHGFSFRSVGFTGMVAAETSAKSMLRVNGFPHIELVGAPVFDVKGRLVGLNTSMFTRRRKTSVRVASSDVIAQAMSLLGLAGGKLS
jgi:S1-C subfamily serine protease